MKNRFSMNGDGKERAPNDRVASHLNGQQPAHPNNDREQQIIEALTGRYAEIEALWNEAEEDLKRFRISRAVTCCYLKDEEDFPYRYSNLNFQKYGKGWRICHERVIDYSAIEKDRPDEVECAPVIEWPLDVRLAMIPHFDTLRKLVIEAAEGTVPTLDKAISSFRKILKG